MAFWLLHEGKSAVFVYTSWGKATIFCGTVKKMYYIHPGRQAKTKHLDDATVLFSILMSDGKSSAPPTDLPRVACVQTTPTAAATLVGPASVSSLDQEQALALESTRKVLICKLTWASNELEHCSSIEACGQLCGLMQHICRTLKDLNP